MTEGSEEPGPGSEMDPDFKKFAEEFQEASREGILKTLNRLSELEIRLDRQNQLYIAQKFLEDLGYNEENIFRGITYEHTTESYNFDFVIASRPGAEPWMVLEVVFIDPELSGYFPGHRGSVLSELYWELVENIEATNARFALSFSNEYLMVVSENLETPEQRLYPDTANQDRPGSLCLLYEHLKSDSGVFGDYDAMREALSPPTTLPEVDDLGSPFFADQVINTPHFKMDLRELARSYKSVVEASHPYEKGKALEDFAILIVGGMTGLEIVERNLRTLTSEIDVVARNLEDDSSSMLTNYGGFVLFECKNWERSVGAKNVRDFIGVLDRSRVELGVIFARNGISGEQDSENASREITDKFQREGVAILVINEGDIKAIFEGVGFHEILEQKLLKLQFG